MCLVIDQAVANSAAVFPLRLVDRLHNPVLHQHVFEFVHGDGGWNNALALIGMNLYCQVTIMLGLLGVGRVFEHCHAAKFGVLHDIGARHEINEACAKLCGQSLRKLQLLVGLALIANEPTKTHATGIGIFQNALGMLLPAYMAIISPDMTM